LPPARGDFVESRAAFPSFCAGSNSSERPEARAAAIAEEGADVLRHGDLTLRYASRRAHWKNPT